MFPVSSLLLGIARLQNVVMLGICIYDSNCAKGEILLVGGINGG